MSLLFGSTASGADSVYIVDVLTRGAGIESVYCLMYPILHGVSEDIAVTLASVVLIVVTMSMVLHGTSGRVKRR